MKKSLTAAALVTAAVSTVLSSTAALAPAGAAPAHSAHSATSQERSGSYRVTAKVDETEPVVQDRITIRATVSPAAPGSEVTLQVKYQDQKAWKTIDHKRLKADSKVSFKDKVGSVRFRTYRVVKATDSRARAGSGKTAKVTVYGWRLLASIQAVSGSTMYAGGSVTINGTSYPSSIVGNPGANSAISFNLNRDCKQLDAVYGISDQSASTGSATLTLTSDGTVKHSAAYALTQAQRVVTDVTGVFRISIAAAPVGGIPAVGSPKLLCSF